MAKPAKAFGNFFTAGASTSQAIAEQAKWRLTCLNLKKSDKLIIFLLQKRYESVTLAASDSCKERKRMNNNLSFANRLGTLRSERGLSKSGLARAVHVSTTCVWNWEEGNTFPRPEALAKSPRLWERRRHILNAGNHPPRAIAIKSLRIPGRTKWILLTQI